jgi:hypothetical protein
MDDVKRKSVVEYSQRTLVGDARHCEALARKIGARSRRRAKRHHFDSDPLRLSCMYYFTTVVVGSVKASFLMTEFFPHSIGLAGSSTESGKLQMMRLVNYPYTELDCMQLSLPDH